MKDVAPRLIPSISHELCVGVGTCIRIAPHAFRYNKERLAVYKGPGDWTIEQLEEAVGECPNSAITIVPSEVAPDSDPPS